MTRLRVIHDLPAAGAWNMAVDEMMLESVAASGEPILRFYRWQEPTLSLGYFQALQERDTHTPSSDCPVVRRSSGGGAILHDQELTYSIAVPLADRWSHAAAELYEVMHAALISVLASFGIVAQRFPATNPSLQKHFLCFQRRAAGDVLVGDHKVAGSAQRRRQGVLLQHGSVILARSSSAPEIAGLQDLGGAISGDELSTRWLGTVCDNRPNLAPAPSVWSTVEQAKAAALEVARFSTPAWLEKRLRP